MRKVATFRTVIFCPMVVSKDPLSFGIVNNCIYQYSAARFIGCVSIAELSSLIL